MALGGADNFDTDFGASVGRLDGRGSSLGDVNCREITADVVAVDAGGVFIDSFGKLVGSRSSIFAIVLNSVKNDKLSEESRSM